ncbi:MAG: lytic murein transglycosylase [Alphaproteobacteria bacterium]|nr:lytic murein transglycosylase [Alphaproteobacteria bacterium]
MGLKFYFTILLFVIITNNLSAKTEEFSIWIDNFKIRAEKSGISKTTIDETLNRVKLIPRIIELDRNQPEFTLTLSQYLRNVVSKKRIKKGISKIRENWELLETISNKYNVQPRFIVALWGIETDFGRVTGGFPVIDALVTLSYDGRRSKYFSKELINALKIIDQGHISYDQMVGSWAGAMGQTQFMPSSFLNFAQDYDNDGRKDIWGTKEDALASAANYLSKLKWNNNETWGREVIVNDNFNLIDDELTLQNKKTIIEWQSLGVRRMDGRDLPKKNLEGYLIKIKDTNKERYFLVYQNFKRILKWNTSNYFAISVGILSDSININ